MTAYEELLDYDRARAWRAPPGLRFELLGEPRVTATSLELEGELINDRAEETEVIVFPAFLALTPRGLERRPRMPPAPPPVPPPPMRFVLQPRERIPFRTALLWSDYVCTSGQEVEVEWSFTYWNEPLPRGTFRVRVP
jgi:hypothetical protein